MVDKPLPPSHEEFLARSAAFAESVGAPPGTFAIVIKAGGADVPIIGAMGGRGEALKASKAQRLRRAREALDALQRRQFRKW